MKTPTFRTINIHWVHGCAAWHDGRSTAACPYHRDSQSRREWLKGWHFARSRERRKTKTT